MPDRSYIGIDSNQNKEWIVAVWTGEKIVLSPPFKNTPVQLAALVRFITERCSRPKICLKPANPAVLKLIKFIGGIPDVEVVLMSEAGLQMHRAWLPNAAGNPTVPGHAGQAFLLACCAERMI
jgi:hypothetical protein